MYEQPKVKIISITKGAGELEGMGAEDLIAYTARVSNPANQMNTETAPRLISYLSRNKHWSPFEMVSMCLEVTTSRAIAQQILRHRSFSFQEFSQRYAQATDFVNYEARRQDDKNRQNSIDDLSDEVKQWFKDSQIRIQKECRSAYQEALMHGIAKEQARFLLPLSTETKIYMSGTARSWIHYIDLRASNGTQKEHKDIAIEAKGIFGKEFPAVSEALGWSST